MATERSMVTEEISQRINERRMMAEEIRTYTEAVFLINELHNLMGTSRTKGSMDTCNIMKSALAQGNRNNDDDTRLGCRSYIR
jgi:ATP-dependent Clp protease ATP-binding subunit ClpA